MEWWITKSGDNTLKGVVGDPDNPIQLDNETIVHFLMHIPQARASFDRLLPTMLLEEQDRLEYLISGSAGLQPLTREMVEDNFQRRLNTDGVRRGGGWAPPPFEG